MNIVFGMLFVDEEIQIDKSDCCFKVKTETNEVVAPILIISDKDFEVMSCALKENVRSFLNSVRNEITKNTMKDRNCSPATADYYPEKVSIEFFAKEVKRNIDNFVSNMERFEETKELIWIEDWMKMFQRWSEMEKGEL